MVAEILAFVLGGFYPISERTRIPPEGPGPAATTCTSSGASWPSNAGRWLPARHPTPRSRRIWARRFPGVAAPRRERRWWSFLSWMRPPPGAKQGGERPRIALLPLSAPGGIALATPRGACDAEGADEAAEGEGGGRDGHGGP